MSFRSSRNVGCGYDRIYDFVIEDRGKRKYRSSSILSEVADFPLLQFFSGCFCRSVPMSEVGYNFLCDPYAFWVVYLYDMFSFYVFLSQFTS